MHTVDAVVRRMWDMGHSNLAKSERISLNAKVEERNLGQPISVGLPLAIGDGEQHASVDHIVGRLLRGSADPF